VVEAQELERRQGNKASTKKKGRRAAKKREFASGMAGIRCGARRSGPAVGGRFRTDAWNR